VGTVRVWVIADVTGAAVRARAQTQVVSGMTFFVLLFSAAIASQETYPKNSEICDSSHPEDDKAQYDCRKSLAGGLECRDASACTTFDCDNRDVAKRAGMLCDGFPSYNGGFPMSGIHWDSENEEYNCLETSTNGTYCQRWGTIEESADEYELGECECQEDDGSNSFCNQWTCRQRETKKCAAGYIGYPSQRFPTSCTRSCDDDDDCSDHTYEPETEYENTEGECVKADSRRCRVWKQEEYDDFNLAFREYEDYVLAEDNRSWLGNIDSQEEFEFSRCICHNMTRDEWCHNWSCFEKGHDYFLPNLLWSLFGVLIGYIGWISIAFCTSCKFNAYVCCNLCWAVVATLFNILFVWLGGLGELLIFSMCYLLPLAVSSVVLMKRTNDRSLRNHQFAERSKNIDA
jgi:hypothetical protein